MTTSLVSFLLAFLVSVALTPAVRAAALRRGLVDAAGVNHRKIHAEDIPRIGGIAIVAGFYAPIAGLFLVNSGVGKIFLADRLAAVGFLAGAGIIALVGLYDDLYEASPKVKLLGQFLAAAVVMACGISVGRLDLPFISAFDTGWMGLLLTLLWIVGITNAVNLIDGLDGLASGIALIGLLPFTVLAMISGNYVLALITLTLAGSVLGFLVFNYHPAKIFMGDTGSMFLGFVLAVAAVHTNQKTATLSAALVPLLSLGLPIMDTLLAIARRLWFGQHPFAGDKQHIHHRLMAAGLSHRNTVLVMWGVAAMFALLGLLTATNRDMLAGVGLGLSGIVAGVLMRRLGFLEIERIRERMAEGAAIRAYNQSVRYAAREFDRRIARSETPEEALEHLDAYLRLIRASAAELVVSADGIQEQDGRSVWRWGDTVGAQGPFRFPLSIEGQEIGTLFVVLQPDDTPPDVAVQRLQVSVPVIAESLRRVGHLDRLHPRASLPPMPL